jgi:hypothetical protein
MIVISSTPPYCKCRSSRNCPERPSRRANAPDSAPWQTAMRTALSRAVLSPLRDDDDDDDAALPRGEEGVNPAAALRLR